jgi:hypothetical protein
MFNSPTASLNTDYVQYFIYFTNSPEDAGTLLFELNQFCDSITSGYIWQRDAFHLKLSQDAGTILFVM